MVGSAPAGNFVIRAMRGYWPELLRKVSIGRVAAPSATAPGPSWPRAMVVAS
jgi:hypothetical protein